MSGKRFKRGNACPEGGSDEDDYGCPSHGGVTSLAWADSTPPELVWAEASPNTLYLHQGPDTVLVRIRATDDESGVASIWPIYYGPGGQSIYGGSLQRVSGTPLDGIWEGITPFPSNSALGQWCLFLSLYDGTYINRRYEAGWMCEHFPQSGIRVETNTPVEPISWGSIKALYR